MTDFGGMAAMNNVPALSSRASSICPTRQGVTPAAEIVASAEEQLRCLTGLGSPIPQSSEPPSSATAIRMRIEREQLKLSQVTALWGARLSKNFQEISEMFPAGRDEAANDSRQMTPSPWQHVPWWMFWKDGRRRRNWQWDGSGWKSKWEYQHVAYVARQALEDYCAPRSTAGESQAPPTQNRDTSTSDWDVAGSYHPDRPSGS